MPRWQRVVRTIAEFEILLYAVAVCFYIASFVLKAKVDVVNTRPFFVNDASLWYEHSEDPMVPTAALVAVELCQICAIAFLDFLLSLYLLHAAYRSWKKVIQISCCSALRVWFAGLSAAALNTAVVGMVKLFVGRLRPDYGQRCLGPHADLPPNFFSGHTLWGTAECITDPDVNPLAETLDYDAKVSFVSGHAAGAFCTSIFVLLVCIYRAWCIHYWAPFDESDQRPRMSMKPLQFLVSTIFSSLHRYVAQALLFVSLPSLLLAIWVAASRIVDNRHHPADVVGGAALGSLFAVTIVLMTLPNIHRDYFGHFATASSAVRGAVHNDDEEDNSLKPSEHLDPVSLQEMS